ncbi:MAG: hypothetical protein ABIH23_31780 [bacterium]
MANIIRIKPHHFIDIIRDIGGGQTEFEPHPYGHAVHTVAARIIRNPNILLRMELGADDICGPCEHNVNGICDDTIDTSHRPQAPSSKREWNLLIDRRWCKRLRLEKNDTLTAIEFCERLRDQAGDISDIYPENPPEQTRDRARKLKAGIAVFLSQAPRP